VRKVTDKPLAVGFGISTREHFEVVEKLGANAIVIGSAVIRTITRSHDEHAASSNNDDAQAAESKRIDHVAKQLELFVKQVTTGSSVEHKTE